MYRIPRHVCEEILRSNYSFAELWVSSEKIMCFLSVIIVACVNPIKGLLLKRVSSPV